MSATLSDKKQLIVNLKSVGTGIDIRTGFTYPMLADGKGYDLNNCVHVTECDTEWLVELNHSDRLLLICCLDSVEYTISEFRSKMNGNKR